MMAFVATVGHVTIKTLNPCTSITYVHNTPYMDITGSLLFVT